MTTGDPLGVPRTMLGFHQDEDEVWVCQLDCGHARHIRHAPPLSSFAWVETEHGRAGRLGDSIECALCGDRQIPEGWVVRRQTRVFDESTVPAGLLGDHRVKAGSWGRLRVLDGELELRFDDPLAINLMVRAGESAGIPPQVTHRVALADRVRFKVEFLRPPDATG